MFRAAETIWFSLPPGDRILSFEPSTLDNGRNESDSKTLERLSAKYIDKFGFPFVIDDLERAPDEVISICRARLRNSPQTELNIASEEQNKMTRRRLESILEK